MIARLLLLIAVFAGLLGGQMEARGICGAAQVCGGCCAPESEASCCVASDQPAAPITAPATGHATDWKLAVQPLVVLLPKSFATGAEPRHVFIPSVARASNLSRIELTCVRLI